MSHNIRYGNGPALPVEEEEYIALWEECGRPDLDGYGGFRGRDNDGCEVVGTVGKIVDEE